MINRHSKAVKRTVLIIFLAGCCALPGQAYAQKRVEAEGKTEYILQSMRESLVEIKTKIADIDETVTRLDKSTTGNVATLQTNQEWLIWGFRGLAGGLLALTIYVFREKIFGKNGNGDRREFSTPKK